MDTSITATAFHPYKVIQPGRSTLQLQPGAGQNAALFVFRFIPLIMLIVGIILYIVQKETFFLLIFGGIALLEAVIFSFIKIPAALTMDSVGFTLETLSIKGRKETYYLWNDIDYIRYRTVRTKNSTSLTYDAMLKNSKKVSFLNFGNYHSKKQNLAEINTVLHQISNKEIREK